MQWKTAVSRYRPFLLATSILLASRHKGMREVASVAWTCARPASCTEYEWFWKAGWQGYCRNAGGMGQLERATANDHCSGGQQVDRKMSIHERGCKGDSTNLWLVILTATRPAWRICKIYFKKKFVINIKALKHFPIVYREKEVIVFIKGRVVLFLQSLNRFLKSYKKGEGGISPIQRNFDKTMLTIKRFRLL